MNLEDGVEMSTSEAWSCGKRTDRLATSSIKPGVVALGAVSRKQHIENRQEGITPTTNIQTASKIQAQPGRSYVFQAQTGRSYTF
jgi:hypothetical protein